MAQSSQISKSSYRGQPRRSTVNHQNINKQFIRKYSVRKVRYTRVMMVDANDDDDDDDDQQICQH